MLPGSYGPIDPPECFEITPCERCPDKGTPACPLTDEEEMMNKVWIAERKSICTVTYLVTANSRKQAEERLLEPNAPHVVGCGAEYQVLGKARIIRQDKKKTT